MKHDIYHSMATRNQWKIWKKRFHILWHYLWRAGMHLAMGIIIAEIILHLRIVQQFLN